MIYPSPAPLSELAQTCIPRLYSSQNHKPHPIHQQTTIDSDFKHHTVTKNYIVVTSKYWLRKSWYAINMFEGMSTSTLNYGGATPTPSPSQPTSSHATAGPIHPSAPAHTAGSHFVSPHLPPPPVPANAFQKAIQKYVAELSRDDKAAFLDAPDVMGRLQEIQENGKPLISESLTARVEKVLQCVKHFMGSLTIFIQQSPEISSLVVGGANYVLTVGTSSAFYYSCANILLLSSLFWDTSSSLSVSPS